MPSDDVAAQQVWKTLTVDLPRAAINLAAALAADLLLMDDKQGVKAARKRAFVLRAFGSMDVCAFESVI